MNAGTTRIKPRFNRSWGNAIGAIFAGWNCLWRRDVTRCLIILLNFTLFWLLFHFSYHLTVILLIFIFHYLIFYILVLLYFFYVTKTAVLLLINIIHFLETRMVRCFDFSSISPLERSLPPLFLFRFPFPSPSLFHPRDCGASTGNFTRALQSFRYSWIL